MERKNKYPNVGLAYLIVLFVQYYHFFMVNTKELKYYKDLFIPADLNAGDMDRLLIFLGNLSLVSKLGADFAIVFTLALLEGEMNMMALLC